MGLDMYAYIARNKGDDLNTSREIAYWRKHPNLHGWMEKLAEEKKYSFRTFNGVEVELTWEDIDRLEKAIKSHSLPHTTGFFFGDGADDIYYDDDLKFCVNAKAELFLGLKVFYNSSW
jgi:hypothetical protein